MPSAAASGAHARRAEPAADGALADLGSAQTAAQALAVFFRMADRWGQALLGVSRSVFFRWQAGEVRSALDSATAERLSYLFRIYAALQVLLPVPERAHAWLQLPNAAPLFGGGTALQHLLGGRVGDLKDVADYLDARRGGDFA
jgi:hypothetical protein